MGFSHHRRRRLPRADGQKGRAVAVRCLRSPAFAEHGGDPHLAKFYKTALGNPALRPLLRRTGLAELRDAALLQRLREALTRARDDAEPDWAAIGQPVAALLDTIDAVASAAQARHGTGARAGPGRDRGRDPDLRRASAGSFGKNGFIPTYAAFNLIGDPDLRGREMLMALTGLNSRGYKNSTLLFNLARIFIARSPARELINPPWRGIAEPMWQPMQIRHRSAYYDAFFTEALLGFVETGLASSDQTTASRRAIADMVEFCLTTSREEVPRARRLDRQRHHRAGAAAASAVFAVFRPDQAGSRLRHLCAGLRHHGLRVLGRDASRLRPIRSSTSRCWISTPATRSAAAPTSRW